MVETLSNSVYIIKLGELSNFWNGKSVMLHFLKWSAEVHATDRWRQRELEESWMPSRIRTHYLLIKRRWLYRCATTVSLKLSKVFNTKGFFIILNYTELTTAWKTVIELCSDFNEELKLGNFLMFSFFSSQQFGRRDVSKKTSVEKKSARINFSSSTEKFVLRENLCPAPIFWPRSIISKRATTLVQLNIFSNALSSIGAWTMRLLLDITSYTFSIDGAALQHLHW